MARATGAGVHHDAKSRWKLKGGRFQSVCREQYASDGSSDGCRSGSAEGRASRCGEYRRKYFFNIASILLNCMFIGSPLCITRFNIVFELLRCASVGTIAISFISDARYPSIPPLITFSEIYIMLNASRYHKPDALPTASSSPSWVPSGAHTSKR